MILALIGESCTGKTNVAELLQREEKAEVYTGRDYLRMAKSPSAAEQAFRDYLLQHTSDDQLVVFVISEKDELKLLPDECTRVLCISSLERIKDRFTRRMRSNLTAPVAEMLEKKHGMFDEGDYLLTVDTSNHSPEEVYALIREALKR